MYEQIINYASFGPFRPFPYERKGPLSDATKFQGVKKQPAQRVLQLPPQAQTELRVNQPNDPYEQEARFVANKVVQEKKQPVAPREFDSTAGPFQMDGETLDFMAARFGYNFSDVQIHRDEEAASRAGRLNARAFTVGNHIYFNRNEYKPATQGGMRLLAHELTHTLQQGGQNVMVQKEDQKGEAAGKPEIDFQVLPPELKLRLWHLVFEADTSRVQLDYQTKGIKTGLSYKYGGSLTLGVKGGDTSGSLGWTPGSNQLGLGFTQGPFSANFSASPNEKKYGLGLRLGSTLLPMPADMDKAFGAGGAAAGSMLTGLPAAPNDPLAFYKAHKDDIDNVSKAVDLARDITDAGKKKVRFGADFSLSYDPVKDVVFTVRAGLMYQF